MLRKLLIALVLTTCCAGVLYAMAGVYLPASNRVLLAVDKRSGEVREVKSGVAYLPPHRFRRFQFTSRDGLAQLDGLVRVLSKERAPIAMTYRMRFSVANGRLSFARSLTQDALGVRISAQVAEAVSGVTQQTPLEQVLSPDSAFATQRQLLRDSVKRHLAPTGIAVVAFEIAQIDADGRANPRRLTRGPKAPAVGPRLVAAMIPAEGWDAYARASNKAIDLYRSGDVNQAINGFRSAIALHPTHPTPYFNVCVAFLSLRQWAAAEDALFAAVTRGLPEAELRIVDLSALYRSRGMTHRVVALLEKGKTVFPQSQSIAANLGSALAEAGRPGEALPELERALALDPESTLALNNLGTFYAQQGKFARALDYWNCSLRLDGAQPSVRAAAAAAKDLL